MTTLWVRGYWVGDQLMRNWGRFLFVADAHSGSFRLTLFDGESVRAPANIPERKWIHLTYVPVARRPKGPTNGDTLYLSGGGFEVWRGLPAPPAGTRNAYLYSTWGAVVPFWAVSLVCGLLPTLRYRAWHRDRSRRRAGSCLTCGYDLRATPAQCPECGTVPAWAAEPVRG